ncbi:MAG TPA: class I SAM-dependent methyltransferase [Candidatus Omnitrophota bacterium]|nr:class I SAM-dependent methyltransferase [Candidatus Omnitrophota bacterium]
MFNIDDHAVMFNAPDNAVTDSYWNEHIPFAFFLMEILAPEVFVELGVFKGGSYNAFCQAVKVLGKRTKCYGVDNWEGDPHNGRYSRSVFEGLESYQKQNYPGFSTLMKMAFDEALAGFADGSVDLLHIDGYHTYEAVKHDYERWLPKMSGRGVMIFHDTSERRLDFGVWKFWEEVSGKFPSFEFKHGCGLGILAVGDKVDERFMEFLRRAQSNGFYGKLFAAVGISGTAEKIISEKELQIGEQERLLGEKERLIAELAALIRQKDAALENIMRSAAWRVAKRLSRLGERIAPPQSVRGRIKERLVRILRSK